MKALTSVLGFWGLASLALAGETPRSACTDISGVWEPIGACAYATSSLPKALESLKLRSDDQLVFKQKGCTFEDFSLEKPMTVSDPADPDGSFSSTTGYYFWDQDAALVGIVNNTQWIAWDPSSSKAPYAIDHFVAKWSLDRIDNNILNEVVSGSIISRLVKGNQNQELSKNVNETCRYHRVAGQ